MDLIFIIHGHGCYCTFWCVNQADSRILVFSLSSFHHCEWNFHSVSLHSSNPPLSPFEFWYSNDDQSMPRFRRHCSWKGHGRKGENDQVQHEENGHEELNAQDQGKVRQSQGQNSENDLGQNMEKGLDQK